MVDILRIAERAGQEILTVYGSAFEVEKKEDTSPLTLADKRSHALIVKELEMRYPDIPILSEEGKGIPYEQRKNWEYFWLVDPLDGTKEFVNRNGEFTVNIALIRNAKSILGVIYVPVKDTFYFAKEGQGAYKLEGSKKLKTVHDEESLFNISQKLPTTNDERRYTIIASRSHLSDETKNYIDSLKGTHSEIRIVSIGSSQKFCLIAEGTADCYPRFGPTMEWDTAAGQVIAEESGATIMIAEGGEPLRYNKENLLNPWFIVQQKSVLYYSEDVLKK